MWILRTVCAAWFALFVLTLAVASLAADQAAIDADLASSKTTGKDAGALVKGRYGTKSTLNQNLSVPMTDSTVQMNTVDGSKSFSAALGIPSSNKFLEILIQPSSTGDLSSVLVSQDLNSDNAIDHAFSLGVPVSGVCANGFISCTPGTWTGCVAYQWISDDAGKLAIQAADNIIRMAGCFCINSSCGSNLVWTNSSIVLQALGGGAVGAIRAKDATTTITNVTTDPVTITYYGQLVRKADSAATTTPATASMAGPQVQQGYYSSWSTLDAERDNISLTQSTDPNSMYYMLTNSAAATNAQVRTCNINRLEKLTPRERVLGYRVTVFMGWDADGSSKECYWGTPGVCKPVLGSTSTWQQCQDLFFDLLGPKIIQNLYGVTVTCKDIKIDAVTNDPGLRCYGSDGGDPIQYYNLRCYDNVIEQGEVEVEEYPVLQGKKDFVEESISNGCASIESDTSCRLRGETVDGVATARNYAATGLNQLPSCRVFEGVAGPLTICRQWWQKSREYVCDVPQPSFDLTRYKTVKDSTSLNGATLSLTDYRQGADGSWVTVPMSGTLPQGESYDTCIPSCKVKRPIQHTETSILGPVSDLMMDSGSFETRYLTCSAGNVCPTEPGDEVVTPCGCVDEFPLAASIMQTMRLSGADNICSSGTPLSP